MGNDTNMLLQFVSITIKTLSQFNFPDRIPSLFHSIPIHSSSSHHFCLARYAAVHAVCKSIRTFKFGVRNSASMLYCLCLHRPPFSPVPNLFYGTLRSHRKKTRPDIDSKFRQMMCAFRLPLSILHKSTHEIYLTHSAKLLTGLDELKWQMVEISCMKDSN